MAKVGTKTVDMKSRRAENVAQVPFDTWPRSYWSVSSCRKECDKTQDRTTRCCRPFGALLRMLLLSSRSTPSLYINDRSWRHRYSSSHFIELTLAYHYLDPGAFAEYCKYPSRAIHAISDDLTALEAVLVEPAACAAHGIERIAPKVGSNVLLFGCGPTGILLAQLLRQNGGCIVCHLFRSRDLFEIVGLIDIFYSSLLRREAVQS